jgi:hypothetical protein
MAITRNLYSSFGFIAIECEIFMAVGHVRIYGILAYLRILYNFNYASSPFSSLQFISNQARSNFTYSFHIFQGLSWCQLPFGFMLCCLFLYFFVCHSIRMIYSGLTVFIYCTLYYFFSVFITSSWYGPVCCRL